MLHTKNQLPRFGGGGQMTPFLHISSSWVKIRLHTENQLPRLPGSYWVVGGVVVQPIPLSLPTWVEVELGCDKKGDFKRKNSNLRTAQTPTALYQRGPWAKGHADSFQENNYVITMHFINKEKKDMMIRKYRKNNFRNKEKGYDDKKIHKGDFQKKKSYTDFFLPGILKPKTSGHQA